MKSPEISVNEIIQAYRKYWWVVIMVFAIGAIIGFLLPDALRSDVGMLEFTIPVVVREQPTTNWKEEDTYALIGFVNAWLDYEWGQRVAGKYPAAQSYVKLRKDTFHLTIEKEGDRISTTEVSLLAKELYSSFVNDFILDFDGSTLQLIEHEACLTDAVQPAFLECIPLTQEMVLVIEEDTFDLGAFLWVGELSEVEAMNKLPYVRYLQTLAAGICAVMLLGFYFLVNITRKYAKVK